MSGPGSDVAFALAKACRAWADDVRANLFAVAGSSHQANYKVGIIVGRLEGLATGLEAIAKLAASDGETAQRRNAKGQFEGAKPPAGIEEKV